MGKQEYQRKLYGEKGFLLAEYVLSLAVMVVIATVCCLGTMRMYNAWQYLITSIQLDEAGRYILCTVEKNIAYGAIKVEISLDGKIVKYQNHAQNRNITIMHEKKALYTYTTTGNGTGKNPMFLEYAAVEAWQAQKVGSQSLLINFELSMDGRKRSFSKLIQCYNSEVSVHE